MCARMTDVNAQFWTSSPEAASACQGLIDRKFEAFMIGSVALACALGFTVILVQVACRCIIVRSITKALRPSPAHHRQCKPAYESADDDSEDYEK
jgi:hypothetical protein